VNVDNCKLVVPLSIAKFTWNANKNDVIGEHIHDNVQMFHVGEIN
jgi:hypothetical protein